MLNKDSIQIIKGMSQINNQAVIEYPISTIANPTRDVLGLVNFEVITKEFDDFGLYDTVSFLGALDILDDPKIEKNNNVIKAYDENSTIEYVTSDPSILSESTFNPEIVKSTLDISPIVSCNIDVDTFNKIKKGVNVFKTLKDLFFVKVGNDFYIKTGNKETFAQSSNSYQLKLNCNTIIGSDFEIAIPAENFLSLPVMEYKLGIHEKNGNYRISMVNEIFKFVLAIKR